jgi:hypothetical protein
MFGFWIPLSGFRIAKLLKVGIWIPGLSYMGGSIIGEGQTENVSGLALRASIPTEKFLISPESRKCFLKRRHNYSETQLDNLI